MDKKMQIGIDVRLWDESGVGRYIRNLITSLTRLDTTNSYTLFALPKHVSVISQLIPAANWKIVEAPVRWHTLKEQIQLARIINKEKVDLMHFPYFSVPLYVKVPFVVTIHDVILHHYPTGKASTLPPFIYWAKHIGYKYVVASAAKRAEKIITVSQSTAKEIVETLHVTKDKVAVTLEGVDSNLQSKQQKSPLKDPYFLYVGNAYPHKNLERLLDALQICILQKGLDCKLVLIGKEDYFYKRLRKKITELHLEKHVIMAGFVEDDLLAAYYQHALALIAPSLMEGFGLTPLEAMKQNCLVIASDIPSFREVCQDAAVYINPFSSKEIANVLSDVYNKNVPALLSKKEKGKKRIQAFSWDKMAQQTLQIYESCTRLR